MEKCKDQNLFKLNQPKGFNMIFFIQLWERFGYAGLQSVLVSFFVRNIGMNDAESFTVFGAFSAMVYGFMAIGGYIGDKVLGIQRTIILGAVTLMIGYILMVISNGDKNLVYIALSCIAVGNGLFKANPTSLLAKLYEKDDPRLDGAFTLLYMSVNVGAFFSMILVPIIGGKYGIYVGFSICAISLALSLGNFIFSRYRVQGIDSPVGLEPLQIKKLVTVICFKFIVISLSVWMLTNLSLVKCVLFFISFLVVIFFVREMLRSDSNERNKMIVAFIMMIQATIFFTLYRQVPTSINFFTIKNVEHSILGVSIANPEVFQSLNPFWIIVLSPIFAYIYSYFGEKGKDLSIPIKFTLGMLSCAIGFFTLPLGSYFANDSGIVSVWWLVISYLFQAIGELLISGLGLSMVAKLVPKRMQGFTMGAWYLTTALAGIIGGWVATLTATTTNISDPLQTLPIYSNFFFNLGIFAFSITIIMALTASTLCDLLKERKKLTKAINL